MASVNERPKQSPHRGSTPLSWLGVLFCFLAGATVLYWRTHPMSAPPKTEAPPPVLTVTVTSPAVVRMEEAVTATGSVAAKDVLEVAAQASGLSILGLKAEEGDFVRAGQVLAVLDSSILEAQLEQARARYASGVEQVAKARRPFRAPDIERVQAAYMQALATVTQERENLRQAEASLAGAEETSRRYQAVLTEGFVTVQEASDRASSMLQARAGAAAARQRYQGSMHAAEQARQQLRLTSASGRKEDVGIAQASTRETAGQIHQLEAQLRQTVVRAPDAGWVITRSARLGQVSSPDKVLFTLARAKELEIRAEIPQEELLSLRTGMPALVNFADHRTKGRIWQISPAVNEQTRLGVARILLASNSPLKPGMLAEAVIRVGFKPVTTLPVAAVLGEQPDHYVYRLVNRVGNRARVQRRAVRVGHRNDKLIEVRGGVESGDQVVVTGAGQLEDQDWVEVAP